MPGFHFPIIGAGLSGLLLDPPLDDLDFVDLAKTKIFTVDKWLYGLKKGVPELEVSRDRANLDERLPFPGPAECVVVGEGARQRPSQGASVPFRPEPQVNSVSLSPVG